MATIQSTIQLNDHFSSVLYGVIDAANLGLSAIEELSESMNSSVSAASIESARESLNRVTVAIQDNKEEQERFNEEVKNGADDANDLLKNIKRVVGAYATMQTVNFVLDSADEITTTTARLNLMNDGLQDTADLQNMIYLTAEDSRGAYATTADTVGKLGLMAGDAFDSTAEIVRFAGLLNKQFTIAGTEAAGIDAAMLQLTQAMASGVLRGEEYNSILEQAPNIIQTIADYMGVTKGEMKDLAAEGAITSDIIKNAILGAAGVIDEQFDDMPMTFAQVGQSIKNTATMAFTPVLTQLSQITQTEAFGTMTTKAVGALSTLAGVALSVFNFLIGAAGVVADNWSWLAPIIYGVAAMLGVYYGAQLAANTVSLVSKGIHIAMAGAKMMQLAATGSLTAATAAQTATQYGLNTAMYACPLVWIIMLIIAIIAVIYLVCDAIAKMTGVADSGFGMICGGINVAIGFFKNLGLSVANIALGIGSAIGALCSNIGIAFHNVIASVQSWWYGMLATVLNVVEGICAALNKIPFISFDYSGITAKADEYAAKSAEIAGSKQEYKSIGDAFDEGMSTFETFQDGWAKEAYQSGAAWGDGVVADLKGAVDGLFTPDESIIPSPEDYAYALDGSGIGGDVNEIAGSLDVTKEELKYLRDIAEQETVNRFTTAEIHVDMSNMKNTVNNGGDLDGFVSDLTNAVNEAIDTITEGVHE